MFLKKKITCYIYKNIYIYIFIYSETYQDGICMLGIRCDVVKMVIKLLRIAISPLPSRVFAEGTEKRPEQHFR